MTGPIRAQNRAELKADDNQSNAAGFTAFTLTGGVAAGLTIGQGTDLNNRVGNQVQLKSFQFRIMINLGEAVFASGAAAIIRFGFVYDKQCNGALPSFGDIFTSYSLTQPAGSGPCVPFNLNNNERFIILYDKIVAMDSDSFNLAYMKKFRRVDLPVRFSSSGATYNSCTSGNICFFQVYYSNALLTVAPTYYWMNRTRYTDV
jgi:hypothetical protein